MQKLLYLKKPIKPTNKCFFFFWVGFLFASPDTEYSTTILLYDFRKVPEQKFAIYPDPNIP